MTHWYETKVGKIIKSNSVDQMDGAIVNYIVGKGWDNVKDITDEQISSIEGNDFMSKDYLQGIVKSAREITRSCDMYNDFYSYIRLYMGNHSCPTKDITLHKEDFSDDKWEEILSKYEDVLEDEPELVQSIDLVTIYDGSDRDFDFTYKRGR